MNAIRTFLFTLLLSSLAASSQAGTCPRQGPLDIFQLNEYDLIFTGRLLPKGPYDESPLAWSRQPKFIIHRVFKGANVMQGDTVTVDWLTLAMLGDIYPNLKYGEKWLIYARQPSPNTPYYRTPCSKSRPLTKDRRIKERIDRLMGPEGRELAFLESYLEVQNQTLRWEEGKIQAEGTFQNGLPTGEWSYFEEGNLVAKGSYVDGKKSGKWTFWGMQNDRCQLYASSLFPKLEQDYVNGYKNGVQSIYYEEDVLKSKGQIHSAIDSITGRAAGAARQGPWKTWWPNGNLQTIGTYAPGCSWACKLGEWLSYRENGTLEKLEVYELENKGGWLRENLVDELLIPPGTEGEEVYQKYLSEKADDSK